MLYLPVMLLLTVVSLATLSNAIVVWDALFACSVYAWLCCH